MVASKVLKNGEWEICVFVDDLKDIDIGMNSIKIGLSTVMLMALTACGTPQKIIHPVSNPELTQLRGKIDYMIDTYRLRAFSIGSYLFPTEGSLFQPIPVTDARNAIVYIFPLSVAECDFWRNECRIDLNLWYC